MAVAVAAEQVSQDTGLSSAHAVTVSVAIVAAAGWWYCTLVSEPFNEPESKVWLELRQFEYAKATTIQYVGKSHQTRMACLCSSTSHGMRT